MAANDDIHDIHSPLPLPDYGRDQISLMPPKDMPSSAARFRTTDVGRPNLCAIVIAREPPLPIAVRMLILHSVQGFPARPFSSPNI